MYNPPISNVAKAVNQTYEGLLNLENNKGSDGGFDEDTARNFHLEVFEGLGSRGIIGIPLGHDNYVAKLEYPSLREDWRDSPSQNQNEIRAWSQANLDDVEEFFMPVVAGRKDGGWLIMERARTLNCDDNEPGLPNGWNITAGEDPETGLRTGNDKRNIDYGIIEREEDWDVPRNAFEDAADIFDKVEEHEDYVIIGEYSESVILDYFEGVDLEVQNYDINFETDQRINDLYDLDEDL